MKYAEYCQQVRHLTMSLDEIKEMLNKNPKIERWAYIVHDKDTLEDGSPKEPHIHVMMEFNDKKMTPEKIAGWFGDKPERIEYAKKRGKFAYNYMLSYLIHKVKTALIDERYEYDPKEVVANFDYVQEIDSILKQVEAAKAADNIDPILNLIADGVIREYEIDDHLDNIQQIEHATAIERAFNIQRRKATYSKDRNMTVCYISGGSGVGKTTFAKHLALSRYRDREIYMAGCGNDPLQRYQGQPCIILDESRDSDWKMTEMLKLLDNNNISDIRSRYSNKVMDNCELIIMTSTKSLWDLYQNMQETQEESIYQLRRRITYTYYMDEYEITMNRWSDALGKHEFVGKVKNPLEEILKKARENQKPKIDMVELTEKALGTLREGVKEGESKERTPGANCVEGAGGDIDPDLLPFY